MKKQRMKKPGMLKLKGVLAWLTALAVLAALAACGGGGGTSGSTDASPGGQASPGGDASPGEKVLRIASTGMMGTLDPAGDSSGLFAGFAMYGLNYLVRFNEKGEILYEAAESYEANEDQTVWTFHLRPEAKWSDGSPVTAHDFINSIHRTLRPDSGSIYTGELFIIKGARDTQPAEGEEFDPATLDNVGMKALDDFTLEFTLEVSCPYFLKLMGLYCFAPSKAGVATVENKTWFMNPETYLCNGPYYLTEFIQDERYTLEKNPYYYAPEKVKIDRIETIVVPDSMARAAAYETGELDVSPDLLENVLIQYEGKPDLYTWNLMFTQFIQFNFETATAFEDERVREAFSLAINREEICTAIGSGTLPNYNFVAPTMVSNDPNSGKKWKDERPQLFTEDVERARELLAEAGYPNGEGFPVYTLTYRNTTQNPDFAVALQAQLKQNLGIDILLSGVEIGVFFAARRAGEYELLVNSWTADYAEPINYLALFVTGGGFASNGHMSDPEYDELMLKSNVETDPAVRNQLMHDAEELLVAEKFYIAPVYTQEMIGLRSPKIVDFEKSETEAIYYRFADILD